MATPAGRVKLSEAIDPLVLAIDIGSTASRGDVYDAAGRPVQGVEEFIAGASVHGGAKREDPADYDLIIDSTAVDWDTIANLIVEVSLARRQPAAMSAQR